MGKGERGPHRVNRPSNLRRFAQQRLNGGEDGDLLAVVVELACTHGERLAGFRFELAKARAGQGRLDEAADHLLTIIERERDWNEDAARKQLLTVFEAAGPTSEVAKQGRRRLSSILFS